MNFKKIFMVFSVAILMLVDCSDRTRALQWDDIRSLKRSVELLRSRDFDKLIEKHSNKKERSFIDRFACAVALYKKRDYKRAIPWFATSVFIKDYDVPSTYKANDIFSLLKKNEKRSPIANEAVYFIAQSYSELGHVEDPILTLKFLNSPQGAILEKASLLTAEVQYKTSKPDALKTYEEMASKYKKITFIIRAANIFKDQKNYSKAVFMYAKAFKFPEIDWSYRAATRQILTMPSEARNFTSVEQVGFAEGLRRLGKFSEAETALSKADKKNFKKRAHFRYALTRAKLLINRSKKEAAVEYVKANLKKFDHNLKADLLAEIARRLNYSSAHRLTVKLIDRGFPNEAVQRHRVTALYGLRSASFKAELEHYMKNYKKNYLLGERLYFNFCLPSLISDAHAEAEKCLSGLRQATRGQAVGARARFYLARIYEKTGRAAAAVKMYREVYKSAPDSSYTYKSLKKGQVSVIENLPYDYKNLKSWLARNAGNEKALQYFFQRKNTEEGYGVDPFWVKWQKKLADLEKKSTQGDLKVALFLALDLPAFANASYADVYKSLRLTEHRILLYQKAAIAADDAHVRHLYMKYYLKLMRKQTDVFLLSRLAELSLYPMPFYEMVREKAKQYNLEISAIYALMRQESQFHSGATSVSNAKGLMQVLPSTARWVNRKLKIPGMNLYNPEHNLAIGIQFFSDMNRQFHGDFEQIAAAYNGGPNWLRRRKNKVSFADRDLFIERIDRLETHYYVKITRSNKAAYDVILNYRQ